MRGDLLRGDAGSGLWTLRVMGAAPTTYLYQVFGQDTYQPKPSFTLPGVLKEGLFTLRPGDDVILADSIQVSAQVLRPKASWTNFLATTPVSPELLKRVPNNPDLQASPAATKAYALLRLQDRNFDFSRETAALDLQKIEATPVKAATSQPFGHSLSAGHRRGGETACLSGENQQSPVPGSL